MPQQQNVTPLQVNELLIFAAGMAAVYYVGTWLFDRHEKRRAGRYTRVPRYKHKSKSTSGLDWAQRDEEELRSDNEDYWRQGGE